MASPVNVDQTYITGAGGKSWIIMNRYAPVSYIATITVTGTATYSLEGTTKRLNRGETAFPFTLDDDAGVPIVTQTATETFRLGRSALEAIRVNQASGAGSLALHVTQQGSAD